MAETLDPEDWTEIVNEMVGHMAAAVETYGGTIAHFGGDSILGLFGAPVAREDDPYRAVRIEFECAQEILEGASGRKSDGQAADPRSGDQTIYRNPQIRRKSEQEHR